jgi:hypothetical protein
MTDLQAACLEPIKLCHLLKERFPFLRIDTLQRAADVICALIEKQTTNQKNLANGLPGTSSPEAKRKRLARCFQDEQFDACVLPFLISLLPKGKLVLSMDRTNWEYGETPLNLLVLGVVLEGFTLPLVFLGRTDAPGHACPLGRSSAWRLQQFGHPRTPGCPTVEAPSSEALEGAGCGPGILWAGLVHLPEETRHPSCHSDSRGYRRG